MHKASVDSREFSDARHHYCPDCKPHGWGEPILCMICSFLRWQEAMRRRQGK